MASGKEVHRVLEAEVKKEVDVEMQTKEDAWALRLLGCIQCFRQLMRHGMTREVYVFGQLQVRLSPHHRKIDRNNPWTEQSIRQALLSFEKVRAAVYSSVSL